MKGETRLLLSKTKGKAYVKVGVLTLVAVALAVIGLIYLRHRLRTPWEIIRSDIYEVTGFSTPEQRTSYDMFLGIFLEEFHLKYETNRSNIRRFLEIKQEALDTINKAGYQDEKLMSGIYYALQGGGVPLQPDKRIRGIPFTPVTFFEENYAHLYSTSLARYQALHEDVIPEVLIDALAKLRR
jgi:hypothetical protein